MAPKKNSSTTSKKVTKSALKRPSTNQSDQAVANHPSWSSTDGPAVSHPRDPLATIRGAVSHPRATSADPVSHPHDNYMAPEDQPSTHQDRGENPYANFPSRISAYPPASVVDSIHHLGDTSRGEIVYWKSYPYAWIHEPILFH